MGHFQFVTFILCFSHASAVFASCNDIKDAHENAGCCDVDRDVTTDWMVIKTEITPASKEFEARVQDVPDDVPIRALNLLKIKDMNMFSQYSAYTRATLPLFDAGVMYDVDYNPISGPVLAKPIGPQQYDYSIVAIVKYANMSMVRAYSDHLSENEEMSRIREAAYDYQELLYF